MPHDTPDISRVNLNGRKPDGILLMLEIMDGKRKKGFVYYTNH